MTTLPVRLRAASHYLEHQKPGLLQEAADRIDELEALVERDHGLIGRMERALLADHHIGD